MTIHRRRKRTPRFSSFNQINHDCRTQASRKSVQSKRDECDRVPHFDQAVPVSQVSLQDKSSENVQAVPSNRLNQW